VDTRRTPADDIAVILRDYFLVMWSYTQGSVEFPWDDIEANPDNYYDSWGFPGKIVHPDRMDIINIVNTAHHLAKNTFTFFSKERIQESNELTARWNNLPPLPKQIQPPHTFLDAEKSGVESEEDQELPGYRRKRQRIIQSRSRSQSQSEGHSRSRTESHSVSRTRLNKRARAVTLQEDQQGPASCVDGKNGDEHNGTTLSVEPRTDDEFAKGPNPGPPVPSPENAEAHTGMALSVDPSTLNPQPPLRMPSPDSENAQIPTNNSQPSDNNHRLAQLSSSSIAGDTENSSTLSVGQTTNPVSRKPPSSEVPTSVVSPGSVQSFSHTQAAEALIALNPSSEDRRETGDLAAPPQKKRGRGRPKKIDPIVVSGSNISEGSTQTNLRRNNGRPQRERKAPPLGLQLVSNVNKGPEKHVPLADRWVYEGDAPKAD